MRLSIILFILMNGCLVAQDSLHEEFMENFQVSPVSVRGGGKGMSPFYYDGLLYFARPVRSQAGIVYTNATGDYARYDLFAAEKIDSVSFKKERPLNRFNSVYNDGPLSVSGQAPVAIITSSDRRHSLLVSSGQEQQQLKLYESTRKRNGWSSPELHPVCTKPYNYFQGCLFRNVLFFCSDLPGGFGGTDIWYSVLSEGKWSQPYNAGASVNSSANELFPFIDEKGELFFSSSRNAGCGLDLYSVVLADTAHEKAELLEAPVNSDNDDFGIWTDSTGHAGYFSSSREGDDGIYYFSPIVPELHRKIIPKEKFCFTFYEEASAMTMDTAGISYEWEFGKMRSRGLRVRHCFPGPGIYPVKLNIIDKTSGEIFSNQLSYDFTVEEPHELFIDVMDPEVVNTPVRLCASRSTLDGYTIKKYYWLFDNGAKNTGVSVRHTFETAGRHFLTLGVIAVNDTTHLEETFYLEKTILIASKAPSTGQIRQACGKEIGWAEIFYEHHRKEILSVSMVDAAGDEKGKYVEFENKCIGGQSSACLQAGCTAVPERRRKYSLSMHFCQRF